MDFKLFLSEKLKERGITLRRLSELTGISYEYLENLVEGKFDKLPSAPYVRGYFQKIGQVLDFDPSPFWNQFEESNLIKRSGSSDELPRNRYAPKSVAKYVWLGTLGIIIIAYLGFRFSQIIGQPNLAVSSPSDPLTKVTTSTFTVKGEASPGSEVLLNGESILADPRGAWQKNVLLEPGLNTVEIKARKFLGRETKITRQILYEEPKQLEPPSLPTSTPAGI